MAVDTAVLQNALRLSEVLEGAVDTGGEVRHIPGLQYQLGHPGQEVWVNGVLSPLFPPTHTHLPTFIPRPKPSGHTHRDLGHGDGDIARLHSQLHALQQV